MKKLKISLLTLLAVCLLAAPAVAQKNRSDKGGKVTGIARSDQMQAENKKSVKDRDPNPSKGSKSKKTRTREGWEKNAKHKGSNK